MTKKNTPAGRTGKIIYWVVTIFLAFGLLAGGVQQMLQIGGYNEIITQLGYPQYLLSILGVWKILGVIAILIPKFPLLKEWAYAGFSLQCLELPFLILQPVNHLRKQCLH